MKQYTIVILLAAILNSYAGISQSTGLLPARDMYIYNGGKDTIRFSTLTGLPYTFCTVDSGRLTSYIPGRRLPAFPVIWQSLKAEIIDSLQVDRKGPKELLIRRKLTGRYDAHGGSYDITEKFDAEKLELWNIETKQLYWEAVVKYSCTFHRADMLDSIRRGRGKEWFTFSFSYEKDGTLRLALKEKKVELEKSKTSKTDPQVFDICPVTTAGTWQFRNGGYVKTED